MSTFVCVRVCVCMSTHNEVNTASVWIQNMLGREVNIDNPEKKPITSTTVNTKDRDNATNNLQQWKEKRVKCLIMSYSSSTEKSKI